MGEMALVQQEEFTESCGRFASQPTETVFAYCCFEGFEIDGRSVEGVILGCNFTRMSWDEGLFNTALISRTTFEDCVFRGCSFRGVDFLDCTFTRCRFELDNLGGACLFSDCRLVECAFEDCAFVRDERPRKHEPLFEKNRFYDCRQIRTRGERPPFG
ncbi:right-handed parallel beta-helix repeat-containing protein [Methylocystis sp. JR02]|uniref:pentapeptide repeat-containing protein n=1 Tax=Methylocystis sp. JR02 TaxID=3046284 RepID=UPI0024B94002|nr:right-handed parallel beta-helix repeat-containing protein [Methylocystis sp. JR02]MDJ0449804.1 right-handed parallel beta-helix repeat-containing protein [Methylocystis sp. JR02]